MSVRETCGRCGVEKLPTQRFVETVAGTICVRCKNEVERRDVLGESVTQRHPLNETSGACAEAQRRHDHAVDTLMSKPELHDPPVCVCPGHCTCGRRPMAAFWDESDAEAARAPSPALVAKHAARKIFADMKREPHVWQKGERVEIVRCARHQEPDDVYAGLQGTVGSVASLVDGGGTVVLVNAGKLGVRGVHACCLKPVYTNGWDVSLSACEKGCTVGMPHEGPCEKPATASRTLTARLSQKPDGKREATNIVLDGKLVDFAKLPRDLQEQLIGKPLADDLALQKDALAFSRTPGGKPWSECPSCHLKLDGREHHCGSPDDPEQMIKVFTLARDLRIPVKLSDFYEAFGLLRDVRVGREVTASVALLSHGRSRVFSRRADFPR